MKIQNIVIYIIIAMLQIVKGGGTLKIRLKFLFLIISTILFCTSCAVMSSSNENDKLGYYQIAVDKTITKDLKVLDKDLEGKEIIFTAEFHGMKSNMELELKFFKYLKEKTNFKYYLCELPYSQGLMLNKFLETGDTDILDKLYIHSKGTYAYTKDSYDRWLQLYEDISLRIRF